MQTGASPGFETTATPSVTVAHSGKQHAYRHALFGAAARAAAAICDEHVLSARLLAGSAGTVHPASGSGVAKTVAGGAGFVVDQSSLVFGGA